MPEDPMLDPLTRRRRVTNPEDLIALLKGTPPPMPSGVAPPVVTPIVQPAGPMMGDAPALGGLSPEKRRILEMIKGSSANQPLTTTPPETGLAVDPRIAPALPPSIEYAEGNETRPAIVGKGPGAGRIQTMIDNPLREVNPDGSAGNVSKMSKKRAFLLGLMKGIDKAGKDAGGHTWGSVIGGGTMGAGIGLASPTSIQKWQRREDVEAEQGLLNSQQKLGQQAANIEETQAQARQRAEMPAIKAAEVAADAAYKTEQLKIQRDVAAGRITAAEATAKRADAKIAQDAKIAADRIASQEKIAGMPSRARPGSDAGPKREAFINESSALYKKADALDANAAELDGHIEKLKAGMATVSDVDTAARKPFQDQIDDLKKQQATLKREAGDLRVKGDGARAKGESIPESAAASTGEAIYAGKRFSRAKVAERAKSLGMTVAQAEKTITDGGGQVY